MTLAKTILILYWIRCFWTNTKNKGTCIYTLLIVIWTKSHFFGMLRDGVKKFVPMLVTYFFKRQKLMAIETTSLYYIEYNNFERKQKKQRYLGYAIQGMQNLSCRVCIGRWQLKFCIPQKIHTHNPLNCVFWGSKTGNSQKVGHFGDNILAKWRLKNLWWLAQLKLTPLWRLGQQKWRLINQVTTSESSKCHKLRPSYNHQSPQLRPSYNHRSRQLRPGDYPDWWL